MKRLFDFTMSFILLLIISPVFLIIAISIGVTMGRPIFFKQERPGQYEKPFKLYKFRTMKNDRNQHYELLPDEQRLTRLGMFLRKYSLDELPQLINVLKGDMSLVGPRPLLLEYLPLYTEEQRIRHEVKPGITGLAQVSGRNTLTWEERFKCDCYYVEQSSCRLDMKILFLTVIKVLKKEGISSENHVTMEKFTGTEEGH